MASSSSAPPTAEQFVEQSAEQPDVTPDVGVSNLQIEAESFEVSDEDSAYGDSDLQSYTTSLNSTILNYRFENGRRYHGYKDESTKYMFPNDDDENDRLDLYHHILTVRLDGELHLAPIGDNPQRILDLGTGTGIWAIDMGDKYPSAEIIGNDISPIQPSLVPPNVRFEVDDIEDEWVYSTKFDFIHSRYMTGSLRDWPKLMSQAYKYTKPGGWVEFQDFDSYFYTSSNGEFNEHNIIADLACKVREGMRIFGFEPDAGPQLEQWIKDAGFINVDVKTLPVPIGTWPRDKILKEIGALNLISFLDNLEGLTLRIYTNAHGWTENEVKVLCARLRTEFKNPRLRMQHTYYVVYGQKPVHAVD